MGYFTQALALSTVSAGKCAFICSLTVVVVPLLSAVLYGKEMTRSNWYSAILALVGVGILEGMVNLQDVLDMMVSPAVQSMVHNNVNVPAETVNVVNVVNAPPMISAVTSTAATSTTTSMSSFALPSLESLKGDLLALGQPIGFGVAFLRIEHYVEKFKNVENRILTMSAAQCVSVGAFSLLWVLYDFHGVLPDMHYMIEPHRIGAIAWTGLMTTVVAIYLEGLALRTASATEAALIFASEPVWASLFGAWLLHEQLGLNSYVGGVAILSACLLGAVSDLGGEEEEKEDGKTEVID